MSDLLIERFFELLFAENQKINLVSRKMPPEQLKQRALADVHCLASLISKKELSVLDIGSGGGLPVVLLAIMLPEIVFTAVEANGKKTNFLQKAQKSLELSNLQIINARIEQLPATQKYDLGIARAVAHTAILLEYFSPLLKIGSQLFLPKGSLGHEEQRQSVKAAKLCGFEFQGFVPNGEQGVVLHYQKLHPAGIRLPRKVGEAKKSPFL